MSNFKLNALLEITLAINENLPVKELLSRYEKILKEDLEIGKVILFSQNNTWNCILNSGFKQSLEKIEVEKHLLPIKEISPIGVGSEKFSDEVDIIIPIFHKEDPIAYVLIGDIDEESEGISPIIKHLRFIQTLSNIIIVAIENIRLYNESIQQAAIKRELELASKMQTMLIPESEKLPSNNYYRFIASYHPHYDVGGDYYDIIKLSDHEVGFCIADVSGKGMAAALLMSNFQANLQALFSREIGLEELIIKLNERVMKSAKGEKFITLFIARFNTENHLLEYVNAGHNPPLLYNIEQKKMNLLKSGCVGIGMVDKPPFINKEELFVKDHMKLFCYTDGLVEVIGEGNDIEFGTKLIEKEISNGDSIDENIKDIIERQSILSESASIFDDISILGVEFYH